MTPFPHDWPAGTRSPPQLLALTGSPNPTQPSRRPLNISGEASWIWRKSISPPEAIAIAHNGLPALFVNCTKSCTLLSPLLSSTLCHHALNSPGISSVTLRTLTEAQHHRQEYIYQPLRDHTYSREALLHVEFLRMRVIALPETWLLSIAETGG